MRRFFLLAAIWVGLLGPIDPLFACAMQAQVADCCPTGSHDQGEGRDHERHRGQQHADPCSTFSANHECHAPIAGATDAAVVSLRRADTALLPDVSAAIGPGVIAAWFFPEVARPPPRISLSSAEPLVSSFGTHTYLRTARLRL